MGVVYISSSAARSPIGMGIQYSTERFRFRRPSIVAFKEDKPNKISLVGPPEKLPLPIETPKKQQKKRGRGTKASKRVKAVSEEEASPCTLEVDYNEEAAKLENIFKLSPATDCSEDEDIDGTMRRRLLRRRKVGGHDGKLEKKTADNVVRNQAKKVKRLDLDKRIALNKEKKMDALLSLNNKKPMDENEKKLQLVREYTGFASFASLDWKTMKIPPVLPSSEQAWLFKLMQPMKALWKVQEDLQKKIGREPKYQELAEAMSINVNEVRKQLDNGRAARNKLITHNLRLVLFVINKYFQDFGDGLELVDLCLAGVQGLITAIDRFELKKSFRLSTYAVFWIRHAIMRYMTASHIFRVPFGLESLRLEIQKAKQELSLQLHRPPTENEIIEKLGISPERYRRAMRASMPVYSLNAKHLITQEELIDGISDDNGGDNRRQRALLRLALDDVLDSLKPKESMVIRQRFGLDGKGNRSLGEIAGNLNISREMVRKHEMKAMMKLKHPTRMDYLRRYLV
uniref:Sigma factor n=1 Tax=Monsonia emarginata TaxID=28966 RepID=A0A0G2SUI2_9ROSI|nr:sigma factor [Monsonia emarginata]